MYEQEEKNEATTESPMSQKLKRELPNHIYAVAAQNAKNRFFVPSMSNTFAGIPYDFVMIDNGCNSFLLPYKQEAQSLFGGSQFQWRIGLSRGSGGIHSPTLKATRRAYTIGAMSLAGSDPLLDLPYLRFHLGTASVQALLASNVLTSTLTEGDRGKLTTFLQTMGPLVSPERRHVLLGQVYLKHVLSLQVEGVLLMGDPECFPTRANYNTVARLLLPLRDDFPEFDDLEDEDHDGDDEECYEHEDIDEPNE